MPLLLKKRRELGLEEEAEALCQNPPGIAEIQAGLLGNGFEPVPDESYDNEQNLEEIFVEVDGDERPFMKVNILGKEILGLLDSGAQRTVLGIGSRKLIRDLHLTVYPSETYVKTASGAAIDIEGYVNLPITFNQECHIIPTLIAPRLNRRLILGYEDFWKVFRLQPTLLNQSELSELCVMDKESPSEQEITDELSATQLRELEEVKG